MRSGAGVTGPDGSGVYHSTAAIGLVDVNLPAGIDSAVISVQLTVTEGVNCTDNSDVLSVMVSRPLAAAITHKTMDGTSMTVTLQGSASGATALQWQRLSANNTWVNIAGATGSVVSYSSFETDATAAVQNFTINGDPYQGKIWQVQIRLHADRAVNGLVCAADSPPVTVNKVTAVDP